MGTAGARLNPEKLSLSAGRVRGKKWTAAAVIAGGGTGTRMRSAIPKQFLELAGKPILFHSVDTVSTIEAVTRIVVVLPASCIEAASEILRPLASRREILFVAGGASRQESVLHGVEEAASAAPDLIMVHDAVRPLCDRDLMIRVLEAAWKKGGAIPGIPTTDTIQRVSRSGRVRATPPREELFAIQTPQAFHTAILISSLKRAQEEGFLGTDESSVVRRAGHSVSMVEGSPDNIKITRPLDLGLASILMSKVQEPSAGKMEGRVGNFNLRIGHGIDYHRLVEGRKLILGGVEIPFEKGLEGHSDADALCHAICDALLGAAALGDIGRHFPDTDAAHRGRSSLEFLREVRRMVEAEGWSIMNVDATLLVQRPRIAPHAKAMKRNIAEALGLAAVSIKATTTERLNAEGRGEGISAHAVALLSR